LNTFIQNHVTQSVFPTEDIQFEPFVISDDLLRYKQFLAEQTKELKAQSENKLQEIMDIENTKQELFEVIHNIIYHRKVTDKTEEEIVPTK
jgi:phosphopantothenate synthetase